MATTCFMTEVAKNGIKWLHIIAKSGNKRNDLQLYRELKSLFCHFWQYFAFSSVIILSKNGNNAVQKLPKMAIMLFKNCKKWQFLLTSKLPKRQMNIAPFSAKSKMADLSCSCINRKSSGFATKHFQRKLLKIFDFHPPLRG